MITVIGLGLVLLLYVYRPQVVPVEHLSEYQTWRLWHDLRHGVDLRESWEKRYLDSVATNRAWMMVAATIAGAGVLVMASSLLVAPKRSRRPGRRPAPKAQGPGQTVGGGTSG